MNKNKKRFVEIISEVVMDLVLTIIFVVIGFLVLSLFGTDLSLESIDFELVALVGVSIFIVIFIAIYAIINKIKSKRKK